MQYEKSVLLKNNKECCIRNAVGDDAQEVLNIYLNEKLNSGFGPNARVNSI